MTLQPGGMKVFENRNTSNDVCLVMSCYYSCVCRYTMMRLTCDARGVTPRRGVCCRRGAA